MPNPPTIDLADLVEPVRALLGTTDAEVVDWSTEPLGYEDFSGGSRTLRRVSGTARASGVSAPVAWSIILKTFTLLEGDDRASDEPTDYDYWRREALFYRSGLAEGVPGGLRPARCFGVDSRSDLDLIWLEDLRELHTNGWPVERFELAARHLGRFNGWWLASGEPPDVSWLADLVSVQEFWTVSPDAQPGHDALLDPGRWSEVCRLTGLPPVPEPTVLRRFLRHREPYLAALAALPQTLCHNDAAATNLFARRTRDGSDETVAIDWQLAGLAPAGSELAMFVAASVLFLRTPVGTLDELDRSALAGYLAGLADAGADIDEVDVRFAYAASTVLRMAAIVAVWLVNLTDLVDDDDREWTEGFWHRSADELALHWTPLVGFLERQAASAVESLAARGRVG